MFEWEIKIPAIQNNVFVAMCNRVGKEGNMDFAGQSIIVDPSRQIVIKADDKEQIIYDDIDISKVVKCRNEKPYISLRRPNVYSKICDTDTEIFKYKEN